MTLTDEQIRLVRLLQEEFPVCERPFAALAEQLGTSEDRVIELTRQLTEAGMLKRISAVLFHTRVGYRVNAMVVWDVPEARLDEAARAIAPLKQLTHCYARRRHEAFDYNLYTMLHERSEDALEALIAQMEALIRPVKYTSLKTERELKKTGMKYFAEQD